MTTTVTLCLAAGAIFAVGVYGVIQHARMNRVANRVRWVEGEMRKMQRPTLKVIQGGKR